MIKSASKIIQKLIKTTFEFLLSVQRPITIKIAALFNLKLILPNAFAILLLILPSQLRSKNASRTPYAFSPVTNPHLNLLNHRLQLQQIEQALPLISAPFKNSPQYVCKGLSDLLDVELTLKIESLNPIKSFKGRGTEILTARAKNNQKIICASAGNFGQGMAYSCIKRGIEVTVYASKQANPLKVEMMRAFGAQVIQAGQDFDEAKDIAKHEAQACNARFVEDSQDIETLEGAGTIGLELLQTKPSFDTVLIPLGNGALASGIARVFKALSPQTKIIAVQANGAAAMVESLRTQQFVAHEKVNTICDGIAIRKPVPQALEDLKPLIDDTLLVTDELTISAMRMIHQHVGITCEPSGAVGVAALLDNKTTFQNEKVATVLCGGNLTQLQMDVWLRA